MNTNDFFISLLAFLGQQNDYKENKIKRKSVHIFMRQIDTWGYEWKQLVAINVRICLFSVDK